MTRQWTMVSDIGNIVLVWTGSSCICCIALRLTNLHGTLHDVSWIRKSKVILLFVKTRRGFLIVTLGHEGNGNEQNESTKIDTKRFVSM